jgi:hypothetical protein
MRSYCSRELSTPYYRRQSGGTRFVRAIVDHKLVAILVPLRRKSRSSTISIDLRLRCS